MIYSIRAVKMLFLSIEDIIVNMISESEYVNIAFVLFYERFVLLNLTITEVE